MSAREHATTCSSECSGTQEGRARGSGLPSGVAEKHLIKFDLDSGGGKRACSEM